MKKIILAALVPAALAGLAPAASAQNWQGHGYGQNNGYYGNRDHDQSRGYGNRNWRYSPQLAEAIRSDVQNLKNQIDRAAYRHRINRNDAIQLRREALDIQSHSVWARRGGLSRDEVRTLQDRVNSVRRALRLEQRDWVNWRG